MDEYINNLEVFSKIANEINLKLEEIEKEVSIVKKKLQKTKVVKKIH